MERYGDDALILGCKDGENVFVFGLTDMNILDFKKFEGEYYTDVHVKKDAVILTRDTEIQFFTRTPPGNVGFLETKTQTIQMDRGRRTFHECEENMLLVGDPNTVTVFRKQSVDGLYEATISINPESDPTMTSGIDQARFVNGYILMGYWNRSLGYLFKLFKEDGTCMWMKVINDHHPTWHDLIVHEHLVLFSFEGRPEEPVKYRNTVSGSVTVFVLNTQNIVSEKEHSLKFAVRNYTMDHSVRFVKSGSNILVCQTSEMQMTGIEVYAFNLRTQTMSSFCRVPKFGSRDRIKKMVSLPGMICLSSEGGDYVTVFKRT
jgi:hypothetical protein